MYSVPTMSFEQFNLSEALLRGVRRQGFETPTPIQIGAIPPALEGEDVRGIAQTGTGKTAAFVLPSAQRLTASRHAEKGRGVRMVVLAPTRELALQIAEDAGQLTGFTELQVAAVYG